MGRQWRRERSGAARRSRRWSLGGGSARERLRARSRRSSRAPEVAVGRMLSGAFGAVYAGGGGGVAVMLGTWPRSAHPTFPTSAGEWMHVAGGGEAAARDLVDGRGRGGVQEGNVADGRTPRRNPATSPATLMAVPPAQLGARRATLRARSSRRRPARPPRLSARSHTRLRSSATPTSSPSWAPSTSPASCACSPPHATHLLAAHTSPLTHAGKLCLLTELCDTSLYDVLKDALSVAAMVGTRSVGPAHIAARVFHGGAHSGRSL